MTENKLLIIQLKEKIEELESQVKHLAKCARCRRESIDKFCAGCVTGVKPIKAVIYGRNHVN